MVTARSQNGKILDRERHQHFVVFAPCWSPPIDGFQPLGPQEHPRLLFRARDVPRLRERAKTLEGRAILAQLKKRLTDPGPGAVEGTLKSVGGSSLLVSIDERLGGGEQTVAIEQDAVVLLDGKPSGVAEALKPGVAVTILPPRAPSIIAETPREGPTPTLAPR